MTDPQVLTCSLSLVTPGVCCAEGCQEKATVATLVDDADGIHFVEHTRCPAHVDTDAHATKSFTINPLWADPDGR